jgi:hypothetical protein
MSSELPTPAPRGLLGRRLMSESYILFTVILKESFETLFDHANFNLNFWYRILLLFNYLEQKSIWRMPGLVVWGPDYETGGPGFKSR